METCDTCKHFSRDGRKTHGYCSNDKFQDANEDPKKLPDSLYYWDYEGYSCGFSVGPKFGCIHHEPK